MVISALQGCQFEFGLIQHTLPVPEFTISELEGLHLNITIPLVNKELPAQSKLPVFVFVHGGGFAIGSNAWPQMDMTRIVKISADMGMPIIGIGIK